MILSVLPWTRKLRLLEARKRAERPKARRRVFVAGDDMARQERVSNVRRRRRARVHVRRRARATTPDRRPAGAGRLPHDTPWGYARIALRRPRAPVYCSPASGAGTPRGTLREEARRSPAWCQGNPSSGSAATSSLGRTRGRRYPSQPMHLQDHDRRMDAKQVWRAALGELQVSLSPANYETWLRDTRLVDVDDQRFRIAVPNGFAKDWLETRYRSLISQTLARVVGYSVQVEFVRDLGRRGERGGQRRRRRQRGRARHPLRPRGADPGRGCPRARPPVRRTSTPATPSRTSSSARPTGSPTRRRSRSPSAPVTPTTRCSCTAGSGSARPT